MPKETIYNRFEFPYVLNRCVGIFPYKMKTHFKVEFVMTKMCILINSLIIPTLFGYQSFVFYYCYDSIMRVLINKFKIGLLGIYFCNLYLNFYHYKKDYVNILHCIADFDKEYKVNLSGNESFNRYLILKCLLFLWLVIQEVLNVFFYNFNNSAFCATYYFVPNFVQFLEELLMVFILIEIYKRAKLVHKYITHKSNIHEKQFFTLMKILDKLKTYYKLTNNFSQLPFLIKVMWLYVSMLISADFFLSLDFDCFSVVQIFTIYHSLFGWILVSTIDFCSFLYWIQSSRSKVIINQLIN